jgi:hypothetical protein
MVSTTCALEFYPFYSSVHRKRLQNFSPRKIAYFFIASRKDTAKPSIRVPYGDFRVHFGL